MNLYLFLWEVLDPLVDINTIPLEISLTIPVEELTRGGGGGNSYNILELLLLSVAAISDSVKQNYPLSLSPHSNRARGSSSSESWPATTGD